MSKNWLIQGFLYNFNPTLKNYILSRHAHFKFCTKNNSTITASMYLDNLAVEIKNELDRTKITNKKTLILSALQKFLKDKNVKDEFITLFGKPKIQRTEVQSLLDKITSRKSDTEQRQGENMAQSFYTRTYLIATHLYLELKDKENDYDALIKDTGALKEFIFLQFNAPQLSSRISSMKNFSYKDILQSKSKESAKGQLKPQFRQIINHPQVFGDDVSQYAKKILEENFD